MTSRTLRGGLIATVLAGAASLACTAHSQEVRVEYLPVDEAPSIPALFASRAAVLDAIRRRDDVALDRWVAQDFGGMTPTARGQEIKDLASGDPWSEHLVGLLTHGGALQGPDRFCAPYWAAKPPDHTRLPARLVFEGLPWAVIVPRAVVRARPDRAAPEVGSLSLELVEVLTNEPVDPTNRFIAIRFQRSRAFVERADVREIDDPAKACFARVNGQWLLSSVRH